MTGDEVREWLRERQISVRFLVEATTFERNTLWAEHSLEYAIRRPRIDHHRHYPWKQITESLHVKVGQIGISLAPEAADDGGGVWINISFACIYGYHVAFYEAVSNLVDHDMVERWLFRALSPPLGARCNALNFGSCLQALDQLARTGVRNA